MAPQLVQRAEDTEMIDTSSRPQASHPSYEEVTQKPKRKLPLYIPHIMSDLMWANTKDSTSVYFGFGHRCHKHVRIFDLEHVRTCNAITDC